MFLNETKTIKLLFAEINAQAESTEKLQRELTEERSRYQNLLSEHLHLQELHKDLKEELELRLVRQIFLLLCSVNVLFSHDGPNLVTFVYFFIFLFDRVQAKGRTPALTVTCLNAVQ